MPDAEIICPSGAPESVRRRSFEAHAVGYSIFTQGNDCS